MKDNKKINNLLSFARESGCSDVHIGRQQSIELRKNGTLMKYDHSYTQQEIDQMIYSILNDRELVKFNNYQDVDKVYTIDDDRYRVNAYHEQNTPTVAIRVINSEIKSLDELDLPKIFKDLTVDSAGLILVTGPTGSGKSTTLAAMIDEINKTRPEHILTIEDPVEYLYEKKQALIHQRDIGSDVESFDAALKSAMREDPDIILVGEMRDYETISAVITLAETGHLVFSTLHTIGASKTIDRIIDIYPTDSQEQIRVQLSGVLNAIITQKLVPSADKQTRYPAFEIMIANEAVRNLIRESKVHQIDSIIQSNSRIGMLTLNNSLMNLVNERKITMAIAKKYSNRPTELEQLARF